MIISAIWAEAKDKNGKSGAIGFNGLIPWYIKNDFRHFAKLTSTGNSAVVMGRRTWESLPNPPLKNRLNIVISSSALCANVLVVKSIEDSVSLCEQKNIEHLWFIGGERIYTDAIKHVQNIYITRVDKIVDADTYAPNIQDNFIRTFLSNWFEEEEKYRFEIWKKLT